MKKIFTLAGILFLFAACNKEKVYKQELSGSWQVYKYLLRNVDQTQQFQNEHNNYLLSFTEGGTFSESYTATQDSLIGGSVVADTVNTNYSGTYSFAQNDQMLVLTNTVTAYKLQDTVYVPYTYTLTRKYTIFNLTSNHVQLRNDTSQLYLVKQQ